MIRSVRLSDVKKIFESASELPAGERVAYLDAACGSDGLRRRVEAMLTVFDEGDGWLGKLTRIEHEVCLTPASEVALPERLGRYTVQRRIATGGMGMVYECIQDNPRRVVAIKVMRARLVSRSAMRRFRDEAHILGRLRHAAIAQIFDAAVHREDDEELPYFVMEFVPGARSITTYARENTLGVRDLIELFMRVCEGVHHGHQKGVVHRDLKPDNILIDEAGQPKIIDFGIASATDADIAVATMPTDADQLMGTLQYMSPEQCDRGLGEIDARSDVYALGSVLYELLCGAPAHDLDNSSLAASASAICELPPKRPSTVNPRVHKDLECIILKALEKEPARRYQSVLELTRDLGAFITGETISARPATFAYQVRVLARRHPAAVMAIVVGMATLLVGVAGTSFGLVRAERSRAREQVARSNAEQAAELVARLSVAVNPATSRGDDDTRTTLTASLHWLDNADLESQPELRASLLATIGRAYLTLGMYFDAEPLLREAAAMRSNMYGDTSELVADTFDDLATTLSCLGTTDEAIDLHRRVLETRRGLLGTEHRRVALAMYNLGRATAWSDEGHDLLLAARDMQYRLLGPDHPETVATIVTLAGRLRDAGHVEEAEPMFRAALAAQESWFGADHPAVARTLRELGWMLSWEGPLDEAEALLREGLTISRALLGADHPETAWAEVPLAQLLSERGGHDEALRLQRHAFAVLEQRLPEDHLQRYWSAWSLGKALVATGEYDLALEILQGAIHLGGEYHAGGGHDGWARVAYAQCLEEMGHTGRAEAELRRACDEMRAAVPDHPRTKKALAALARVTANE